MSVEGLPDEPLVDLEALLVALVLVPHSYPRNRFFHLFRRHDAREVRRRAGMLRSLIADLSSEAADVNVEELAGGAVAVRYHLPDVGMRRTTLLDRGELALVKHAVDRRQPCAALPVDPIRGPRLVALLSRLFPA